MIKDLFEGYTFKIVHNCNGKNRSEYIVGKNCGIIASIWNVLQNNLS